MTTHDHSQSQCRSGAPPNELEGPIGYFRICFRISDSSGTEYRVPIFVAEFQYDVTKISCGALLCQKFTQARQLSRGEGGWHYNPRERSDASAQIKKLRERIAELGFVSGPVASGMTREGRSHAVGNGVTQLTLPVA